MLKNKSNQYLFKNKINLRRKSKGMLLKESILMLISSLILLLINYLIPKKFELINSFKKNIFEILNNLWEILINSFDILIVIFIFITSLISIVLIYGSISRLVKIFLKKTRKIRIR